jgi:hypothetical protein
MLKRENVQMRVNEKEKESYNKMYKERGFSSLSEYIKHLLFIDYRNFEQNKTYFEQTIEYTKWIDNKNNNK